MTNELVILWTNADPITTDMMVFMYAENAIINGWWEKVTIVVWGKTAKLIAEDAHIQQRIKEMKDTGVSFSCCLACATQLGVVDAIEILGLELKYWGEPLTELIKSDAKIITI